MYYNLAFRAHPLLKDFNKKKHLPSYCWYNAKPGNLCIIHNWWFKWHYFIKPMLSGKRAQKWPIKKSLSLPGQIGNIFMTKFQLVYEDLAK